MNRPLFISSSAFRVTILSLFLFHWRAYGDDQEKGDRLRRQAKVAAIGRDEISVEMLESLLKEIPIVQKLDYGKDEATIRSNYRNDVLIRDTLLELGAERNQLTKKPPYVESLMRARARAALRRLEQAIRNSPPSTEEIENDYRQHHEQWTRPERARVWRILVASKQEAEELLVRLKKDPTPHLFTELAREKSLDKATYLRSGDLGFVAADGTSHYPQLQLLPSIAKAALQLHDGELSPIPVEEGDNFAILWRRGTLHGVEKSLAEAREEVCKQILDRKWDEARAKHLAELRAKHLKKIDPDLLVKYPLDPERGEWTKP